MKSTLHVFIESFQIVSDTDTITDAHKNLKVGQQELWVQKIAQLNKHTRKYNKLWYGEFME